MASKFFEITDTSINKKALISVDWIKAVFPIDDKTAIIVGDGFFNPLNNDDQPERYLVAESYDHICEILTDMNVLYFAPGKK